MSFKRRLVPGVLLVALTGCSLYEGPPPPRKKEFSQGNLGCLKELNTRLELYFDGKSSASDVNRIADCAIGALRTFGDLVRGENRDRFTAGEVRDFLQRYFLDDVVFSEALMRELMRVKQALVGGKASDFTPEDLKEAEVLVNVLRDVLLRLQPSMPLSVARVRKESVAYVETEARAVADVGEILGRRITEKDSTYSFEEMGRLFDEIVRVFPGAGGTLGGLRGNLKLAGVLKEMLIAPNRPRGTVTAAEWRLLFQDGGRWLGNYLKYLNLQGKYADWARGEGRARLSVVLGESIDLLERVVARHCPRDELPVRGPCRVAPGVPFALIQEVLETVDWDGSIGGAKFEKSTIKKEIAPLFRHFFGGTDFSETGRAANRVTLEHLDRFRALIREWVDGARYVEGLYAGALGSPDFDEESMIATSDILKADVRGILRANGGVTDAAVRVADGLRGAFSRTIALSDRGHRGAYFDGKNKTRKRIYRELARYAWLKPLMKFAVLGYMKGDSVPAREERVERDGLTRKEFEDLIADYWPLLLDFKMVGPRNSPEGDSKNRFREASLFTPVSDGNSLISIEEGVQLVLYMLSANPLGDEVHARMARLCKIGPPDDYGEPTIEPKCYREKLYDFRSTNADTADLWKPFPVLIRFYESLAEDDRKSFRAYLELAVRKTGVKPEDYFGSDDSDVLPMLFHYVEALFLRFDLNDAPGSATAGDGFVDKAEAKAAFPVFRNILSEVSGMKPTDAKLPSVFSYLLAKGNPPIDDEMGRLSRFWHGTTFLWWDFTKPDFRADRLHLVQVFATLSNTSTKTPAPAPRTSPSAP